MSDESIARVAHEANRAWCEAHGDFSQSPWEGAPAWQRASILTGVAAHRANPAMTPEQSHALWLAGKTRDGWRYGPQKRVDRREHPCMRPYAELPAHQRTKDALFTAVVGALLRAGE
ncbi:hypothetical protein J2T57_001729 [Natronocella acetinitrilica]|uniref:Ryanodine receptor Ryr domain-containing protein n=1 Tax=Natronocella acetinitrilica TaxID=414046 RepID=A0AAE3G395_9GAMM|nr:RyR domain-containing protein [Natronocella acetinitrilica]MCP1674627.1 hypothetical protein [Natronocella acetinitrilica]